MPEKEGEVHQPDMEDIRVGMSKFSLGILMYKISYKDYSKALKVQHYLQHEGMKDIKMEEFIKIFRIQLIYNNVQNSRYILSIFDHDKEAAQIFWAASFYHIF